MIIFNETQMKIITNFVVEIMFLRLVHGLFHLLKYPGRMSMGNP
jgi:hypothetical protein